MKANNKILVGFSILFVLVIFQVIATHNLQSDLYDNTLQLKDVEMPLKLLIQQGVSYGTIASEQIYHSILHMQKGEYDLIEGHKATYEVVNVKLNEIFNKDSKILVSKSSRSQEEKEIMTAKFKEIERLHNLAVDLATKSFKAIDKKENDLAFSLVMGGDYERYQQEIQLVVKDLSEEVDKNVLDIENNLLKESQQIIYLNLGISIGILVMIILTMLILLSFIKTKEKELDLREKAELGYKKLFENTSDAIFIADAKTRQLTDCNKSAERLIGRSKKEIISMKADELHPKDLVKFTMEGFKKQVEGKTKFLDTWVLTKDKKRIPVRITSSIVLLDGKLTNQGIFLPRKESKK
jgi:PAS domain S-box-containing protein